jgi:hypothetical protein
MRWSWFPVVLFAVAAHGQPTPAAGPVIQVDYSNPGLSSSQWTLVLHPDGSGHFRSHTGNFPNQVSQEIDTPAIDRDIQLGVDFAGSVFAAAERHQWFNESCESHLKVAFQGEKTLSYSGPGGKGSCTFNYSKDKEIQALGDSFVAVAETIFDGARLELLLQHDRLGLDAEIQYLAAAVSEGRAKQLCAIRPILDRLAQDPSVLERVRKRARVLLAQATI